MADSKISELTALTTPASDDVLAIVDTSAGVTKKIAISNLATSSEVVDDTSPQLGGDLDVNGNAITSASNGHIEITPNGTGKVGIGTASPNSLLDVRGTGTVTLNVGSTDGTNARLTLDATNGDASGGDFSLLLSDGTSLSIEANNSGSNAFTTFKTNGSERMRIDSSGTVLIGKTSSSFSTVGQEFRTAGATILGRSGAEPLTLNRTDSDGGILNFRKDNTVIGTIGVDYNDNFFLSGKSDHAGIMFAGDEVYPYRDGNYRDATLDLGASSGRWKDLYLSGKANVNSIDIKNGSSIHGTILTTSSSLTLNGRNTGNTIFQSGGNEKMRLTTTGLGIGTASPSTKLTIDEGGEPPAEGMLLLQANSSTRQLRIQPPTNSDNGFIDYRGGNLVFMDDGTEVARFQGSTGFGIGTASPARALHVSSGAENVAVRFESTDTEVSLELKDITGTAIIASRNDFRFTTGGSESMRIDSTGKVGIGTTSPNSMFEVRDDASPTIRVTDGDANNITHMQADGANGGYFGTLTSHDVRIAPNNSTKLIVKVDGKVGIGTTSPTKQLGIGGTGDISLEGSSNAIAFYDSAALKAYITSQSFGDHNGDGLGLVTSGDEPIKFFANGGERMRIEGDGKVGIGETAPLGTLHIKSADSGDTAIDGNNDDLVIENDNHAGITISTPNDKVGALYFSDPDATASGRIVYDHNTNYLALTVNNAERMRITSSGQVSLGTSSPVGSSRLFFYASASTPYGLITQNDNTVGSMYAAQFLQNDGSTELGSIKISNTATAFNTSSDYRLKENVDYTWDATTRLKQLKPARFNFIADADTTVDGFLAHEVSSIVPEAISGDKDATETKTKVVVNSNGFVINQDVEEADWIAGKIADDDGNTRYPTDSTWAASKVVPKYQGIDQSKLVPLLVKTIQELEARITTLENN